MTAVATTDRPAVAMEDSRARLRRMFDAEYRFIWRSVRRLGVPEADADDAAQEVFVIAAKKLDQIALGAERAFLVGTAMRIASDRRRARGRRPTHEGPDSLAAVEDPRPGQDELTDQKRAREQLDRALAELPIELSAPFVLFEIEGLTLSEIADVLGLPRGTVSSRLKKARESFERATRRAARGAR